LKGWPPNAFYPPIDMTPLSFVQCKEMLSKFIIIITLLFSTLCFAKDRIISYTDDKGNKVYTTENQEAPKPQQKTLTPSPIFKYRDPVKQPFSPIHENNSIGNNKNNSVPPTIFVSKPTPLTHKNNSLNQPDFSKTYNSLIDKLIHQLAIMLTIVTILFIIWLLALIDILRSEFSGSNKLIWFLTVTFLPLIGSILYFFIGDNQKIKHPVSTEDQDLNIRTYKRPEI
jgi:hypothetical protein